MPTTPVHHSRQPRTSAASPRKLKVPAKPLTTRTAIEFIKKLDFKFEFGTRWMDGQAMRWVEYDGWKPVKLSALKANAKRQADWEKANPEISRQLHEVLPGCAWDWELAWNEELDDWCMYSAQSGEFNALLGDKVVMGHGDQMDWEMAHPEGAEALRKYYFADEKEERDALHRRHRNDGPLPSPEEARAARNLSIMEREIPGYAHRRNQIRMMVTGEERRQPAAGLRPATPGRSPSGSAIHTVDMPQLNEVLPQTFAPDVNLNDGGPDLVGAWVAGVDGAWSGIFGR